MTVAMPGEDDLPRRERRVEGNRTQGLVARVDAQLGQHRHPDPGGDQRVDGGAVIAASGDPRRAARGRRWRPWCTGRTSRKSISGRSTRSPVRHVMARAQRPVGTGEHQVRVVEHMRRRERPGSDGQAAKHASRSPPASCSSSTPSSARSLSSSARSGRTRNRWPTRSGAGDGPPRSGRFPAAVRALEADRLEVRARGHEPGGDLVDVLQEAKAGRRDGDRPAAAGPLHERLAHEPLEARHLPAERGQAVPETVGRRTERAGRCHASQGDEVTELDTLPGLIEVFDHSRQYIRLFLTPGVCQCGPPASNRGAQR